METLESRRSTLRPRHPKTTHSKMKPTLTTKRQKLPTPPPPLTMAEGGEEVFNVLARLEEEGSLGTSPNSTLRRERNLCHVHLINSNHHNTYRTLSHDDCFQTFMKRQLLVDEQMMAERKETTKKLQEAEEK